MTMISFIIPAYNEEALLGRTLAALHEAAAAIGREYEIVVANDDSTDATAAIALAAGARVVNVKNRQIAATRNAGAREARGELLIFVDADTIVPPQTLRAALAAVDAGAVGGGSDVDFDGKVPWPVWLYIVGFMFVWRRLGLAAGCFLFARREALNAAGGWDERYFAGEEMYLSRALKRQGKFVVLKEAVISSGRKARMYSLGELLALSFRMLIRGRSQWQRRDGLDLWYDGRREQAPIDGERPQDPDSR